MQRFGYLPKHNAPGVDVAKSLKRFPIQPKSSCYATGLTISYAPAFQGVWAIFLPRDPKGAEILFQSFAVRATTKTIREQSRFVSCNSYHYHAAALCTHAYMLQVQAIKDSTNPKICDHLTITNKIYKLIKSQSFATMCLKLWPHNEFLKQRAATCPFPSGFFKPQKEPKNQGSLT